MRWLAWARIQCDVSVVMLTRLKIIYFYLFGCLVLVSIRERVYFVPMSMSTTAKSQTHKEKNILYDEILVSTFFVLCSRNLMVAGERFCLFPLKFSFEYVLENWFIIFNEPNWAVRLFTFSPRSRFEGNFKMEEQTRYVRCQFLNGNSMICF